jgi:hypothetical protein
MIIESKEVPCRRAFVYVLEFESKQMNAVLTSPRFAQSIDPLSIRGIVFTSHDV